MPINGQFDVLAIFSCGVQLSPTGGKCIYCHTDFLIEDFHIGDAASEGRCSVCNVCAWERVPNLMRLIQLHEDIVKFAGHPPAIPQTVQAELNRRANDPERLKCELQEALESLDNHGHGAPNTSPLHTSPLAKIVADRITAARDSGDVETMKEAKRLYEESSPMHRVHGDDSIPF